MGDDTKTVQENVAAINLNEKDDDFVDPWNVESKSDTGIDYDKLIGKYLFTTFAYNAYNVHHFIHMMCAWFNVFPQNVSVHPKLTMR